MIWQKPKSALRTLWPLKSSKTWSTTKNQTSGVLAVFSTNLWCSSTLLSRPVIFCLNSDILAMMAKMENKKFEPIQGDYSDDLKQLAYSLLSFEPKERPSVHKILEVPFIKKHLPQVLENSINKYSKTQQSALTVSNKKLCESNGTSSLRKMSNKKSVGSLSNSICTPLSKKNEQSMTSVLQPHQSSNIPSCSM